MYSIGTAASLHLKSPRGDTGQRRGVSAGAYRPGAGTGGMSDTQTEKRTATGQSRTDSAAADQGKGHKSGETDGPDQAELSRHLAEIAEKSQRLVADFLARRG